MFNRYKLGVEPISIILMIIFFLGGGVSGFFVGKGTVKTTEYDVDIQYYDIKTDVNSKTDMSTDVDNKTDVITSILQIFDGQTNLIFTLTNNVTNYTIVTNTNNTKLYTTNSFTNFVDLKNISNLEGLKSNLIKEISNL